MSGSFRIAALAVLMVTLAVSPAWAEEVEGKWRLELHLGGVDPGDQIFSESANVQQVLFSDGMVQTIGDPRIPLTRSAEGRISTDLRVDFRAGYGLTSWKTGELILDIGLGQYDASVDNLELSYLFDNSPTRLYQTDLIRGGDLKLIPVSVNVLARYRPTKKFNPYIGGGLGYMFVEFGESSEFAEIANQLDQSWVSYVGRDPGTISLSRSLVPEPGDEMLVFDGDDIRFNNPNSDLYNLEFNPDWLADPRGCQCPVFLANLMAHDLARPRIDAPSTAFLELRGGVELQWKKSVSFFTDMRYVWARDEITITADGRQKFGEAVVSGQFTAADAPSPTGGTPAYIPIGGIVADVGSGAEAQPGLYFLNGGTLDYGGFSFSAGVRFTL